MSDEVTLTLNSPITEEQWDAITDVDFDNTEAITFYTKHGKEVEFVKRNTGHWINVRDGNIGECDQCGAIGRAWMNYCPICGADMREPAAITRDIVHQAIDNSVWSKAVDVGKMHKVVDDKYAEMEIEHE